jgi:hypothetical protein
VYDLANLGTTQIHRVKEVKIHPDYSGYPDPSDDVAIVRVSNNNKYQYK